MCRCCLAHTCSRCGGAPFFVCFFLAKGYFGKPQGGASAAAPQDDAEADARRTGGYSSGSSFFFLNLKILLLQRNRNEPHDLSITDCCVASCIPSHHACVIADTKTKKITLFVSLLVKSIDEDSRTSSGFPPCYLIEVKKKTHFVSYNKLEYSHREELEGGRQCFPADLLLSCGSFFFSSFLNYYIV